MAKTVYENAADALIHRCRASCGSRDSWSLCDRCLAAILQKLTEAHTRTVESIESALESITNAMTATVAKRPPSAPPSTKGPK